MSVIHSNKDNDAPSSAIFIQYHTGNALLIYYAVSEIFNL